MKPRSPGVRFRASAAGSRAVASIGVVNRLFRRRESRQHSLGWASSAQVSKPVEISKPPNAASNSWKAVAAPQSAKRRRSPHAPDEATTRAKALRQIPWQAWETGSGMIRLRWKSRRRRESLVGDSRARKDGARNMSWAERPVISVERERGILPLRLYPPLGTRGQSQCALKIATCRRCMDSAGDTGSRHFSEDDIYFMEAVATAFCRGGPAEIIREAPVPGEFWSSISSPGRLHDFQGEPGSNHVRRTGFEGLNAAGVRGEIECRPA